MTPSPATSAFNDSARPEPDGLPPPTSSNGRRRLTRHWWPLPLLIVVFSIFSIAALWTVILFESDRDRASVKRHVITNSDNLVRAIEEHTLRTVKGIDLVLLSLRRSYGNDPTNFEEHLKAIRETADKDLPLHIGIVGSDGMMTYSHLGTITPVDMSDREHFRVHRDSPNDTLFIGRPVLNRVSGQWTIQFSRRLNAPDGSFGGVIVQSVAPEYFIKFYQSMDIGADSNISLFGMDRVMRARVTSPHSTESTWEFVLPSDRPYFNPAPPDFGHFQAKGAIDGVERLFSWRRLKDYPLVVTVAPSVKKAFAEFEDRRRIALAGVGMAATAIALFASILIWLMVRQDQARATLEHEVKKRRATEAALRLNEQRLQTIIETEPECVKILGRSGELLEMNAAGLAMLEARSLGEVRHRALLDFVVPEYRAAFSGLFSRVMSGEPGTLEFEVIGIKGTRRWLKTHAAPLRDSSGKVTMLLGVTSDITEHKRAEAEREAARQLLQTSLDSVSDGVALFDKDERLVLYNEHYLYRQNLPPGFLKPGITYTDIITALVKYGAYIGAGKDMVDRRVRQFRALESTELHMFDMGKGECWVNVHLYRTRDGGTFLVRTDITERKIAEDAQRRSEARLRALVENSPFLINIKDSNGRYLMVGSSWVKFWGITAEQAIGKTAHLLHPKDIADQIVEHDRAVLAAGKHLTREFLRSTARGPRTLSVTKFPIYDEQGQLIAIGAMSVDITAQRQLEEELRQSQKMEAVGQLTAGVAHDFNNMLAIVQGNLELAQEVIRDGKTKDKIANALEATHRAAALTGQLLAFGRRAPLHPVPTDLSDLIRDLGSLLRRTLGEAIEIKTILATALPRVLIDKNQMENALINLALNARDAMPRGSLLTIKTAEVVLNETQAKTLDAEVMPGRYVTIEVTDTGQGMTPEVASRAFEPFFTTKAIGRGSGLGLSMVYGFVKQSGGHAKIFSEPGHGTTVKLYFPVAPKVAKEVTKKFIEEPSNVPCGGGE